MLRSADATDTNQPSLTHPRSLSWRRTGGCWSWWGWRSVEASSPRWSETWACSSSLSPSASGDTASLPHAACLGVKKRSRCEVLRKRIKTNNKLFIYIDLLVSFTMMVRISFKTAFWFVKLRSDSFLCHHSFTHPGRCWRWTQTPGSPSGSSLTGESAPCSASAWTKKKMGHKLIFLSHQWRQSWGPDPETSDVHNH